MKVLYYPSKLNIKKSSLILGAFEVIHNGHLELIKKAKSFNDPIVIMVVEDPSLLPKSKLKPATNLNVRLAQLANLNIDYVIVVSMKNKIITTKGYDFVKEIANLCSARRIILGKDFKTGHKANYRASAIKEDFPFTIIVDFLKLNATKISSSIVKELLEVGEVEQIAKISPFPFQREFFFNENKEASSDKYSLIHPGIYACYCEVNDIIYWCVIHINTKNKIIIYVPDLIIKKKQFQAKIWFHKKIRTITKLENDGITTNDKKIVASYLNSL